VAELLVSRNPDQRVHRAAFLAHYPDEGLAKERFKLRHDRCHRRGILSEGRLPCDLIRTPSPPACGAQPSGMRGSPPPAAVTGFELTHGRRYTGDGGERGAAEGSLRKIPMPHTSAETRSSSPSASRKPRPRQYYLDLAAG